MLALRYWPQIRCLHTEGGVLLGEWAARRIIEGIRQEKIDHQQPLALQYVELVTQVILDHDSLMGQLEDAKQSLLAVGEKNQLKPQYMIPTLISKIWREDGIFTKTGIVIQGTPHIYYASSDNARCDIALYGYRWGTLLEAERLGFKRTEVPHPRIIAPEEHASQLMELRIG